jgi:methylmalonyl-CoA mutase N-terminal domain/subunit
MRDRFGARDPRAQMLRFHAQTAGSTLTAQQPLGNIVRTAVEALAAVMGGAQSVHTNGYDEALSLPTESSARLALRTQQILAFETGAADVVDPLGGAYAIEALTSEIEERATALLGEIDARGGMVAAIEAGYPQREIERRAFEHQRGVETGTRVVVGVNRFTEDAADPASSPPALHRVDPAVEAEQVDRLARLRATRDAASSARALDAVSVAARGTANLLPALVEAVKARATLGEIADRLRTLFGEYRTA